MVAGTLLAAIPRQAFTQQTTITGGTRIKLAWKSGGPKVLATYLDRSENTLMLRFDGPDPAGREVPLSEVARLEIDKGRRHPIGQTALIGVVIGALAGGVAGAAVNPPCAGSGWCIGPSTSSEMVLTGFTAGAIVGSLVGVVVGAIGHHQWVKADLTEWTRVDVRPGMVVGLRIPLRL